MPIRVTLDCKPQHLNSLDKCTVVKTDFDCAVPKSCDYKDVISTAQHRKDLAAACAPSQLLKEMAACTTQLDIYLKGCNYTIPERTESKEWPHVFWEANPDYVPPKSDEPLWTVVDDPEREQRSGSGRGSSEW